MSSFQLQPAITATSQTSRFHVDTITTLSREIDLKQVTISIGDEDIISDCHLRLKGGVHYGLVGRNGTGKSTLLHAIGNRIIPGIPDNLRILLVSQVEGTDIFAKDINDQAMSEYTVTQRVVASDQQRELYMKEHRVLSHALESSTVDDLAVAFAQLQFERSQRALEEAHKIALRRSGQRGSDARKALLQAEAKVSEDRHRLESRAHAADLHVKATELLEDIQTSLDAIDASSTEARAQSILVGLGFTTDMLTAKFSTLSGGWRSRCSLASALLQRPDLLLLDECTNFLDLFSVIWLTNYLVSLPCTIVSVAHDRDFLDAVCDEIIVLRNRGLTYHIGNLSQVELAIKKKRKGMVKMQNAMEKKKGAIEKSIADGSRRAKQTGDETLQKQVKSRKKKLDERWGLEVNAKGHKFKLNRDLGGYHLTSRTELVIEELDRAITLPFPDPEPLRFPGALISATDVSFRYTSRSAWVVEKIDLKIHPGGRVALVGRNGDGKSTLLKLLIGVNKPTSGSVERHPRLRFGYFDQHSVEALSGPEFTHISAVEHFTEKLKSDHSIEIDANTARSFLGSFGLQGKRATAPVASLSGGQKVRLALALIVYPSPDLLVLDEVSTHLDLDTISGLIRALKKYAGAVLLVSHDRHLVRCIIEGAPLLPKTEMVDDDDDAGDASDTSDSDADDKNKPPGVVYLVGPKAKFRQITGVDAYVALVEKRVQKMAVS